MKEKELRFALVCYGGVSLAVYMHGITKEICKLARASRSFHALPPGIAREDAVYAAADGSNQNADTEAVYFRLLQQIGAKLDLRIIVDVIAGASAGGVNGLMLARALAHDLDVDALTPLWLEKADVDELLDPHARAAWHDKWYVRLFLRFGSRRLMNAVPDDAEFRRKLSLFMRSRWFKPPFDGNILTRHFYDSMNGMGTPVGREASLLPLGHRLDAFVTVTNYHGYPTRTRIHDPPFIDEREHRQSLSFTYRHWPRGRVASDFATDNLPGLTFAARATSSFPGAFPPATLAEIDHLLVEKGIGWTGRVDFIARNLRPYLSGEQKISDVAFLDGAVLINKPFAQAIAAIEGRPAFRHVDRRLLYIEPNPRPPSKRSERPPGFFSSLKGALSDIPRQEPIHDDLTWVTEFNREVGRLKSIIDAARPHISALVNRAAKGRVDAIRSPADVAHLRDAVSTLATQEAGFAYEGYMRLKLDRVLDAIIGAFADICGMDDRPERRDWLHAVLHNWANRKQVAANSAALNPGMHGKGDVPEWVAFLMNADVAFRQRRIRFVIRSLNTLYAKAGEDLYRDLQTDALDCLKEDLYSHLAQLNPVDRTSRFPVQLKQDAVNLLTGGDARMLDPGPFATAHADALDKLMGDLADHLALEEATARTDALIAAIDPNQVGAVARWDLVQAYVGFGVWDVITYSLTHARDLGEFDEVRVDRISPLDAATLREACGEESIQGQSTFSFGAFFSRRVRENDYLWGRLHAAERLIDIVLDAARLENAAGGIDPDSIKRAAFSAILEAEAPRLTASGPLIARLRTQLGLDPR